jgi:phage terminase large subunit GpA-like protein
MSALEHSEECPHCGEEVRAVFSSETPVGTFRFCLDCSVSICRLCEQRVENLEYHHVSYVFDTGLEICERCHYRVHNEGGYYDHFEPEITRPMAREWELDCTLME